MSAPKRIKYKGQIYEAVDIPHTEHYDVYYAKNGKDMVYYISGTRDEVIKWTKKFIKDNKLDSVNLHNLHTDIVITNDDVKINESISGDEISLNLSGVSLLDKNDVKQLPSALKQYGQWWWTKTPFKYSFQEYDSVLAVDYDGGLIPSPRYKSYRVRPVLTIDGLSSVGIAQYANIGVNGHKCVYLGGDRALWNDRWSLLGNLSKSIFDDESNEYGTSEIKAFIEQEFPLGEVSVSFDNKN